VSLGAALDVDLGELLRLIEERVGLVLRSTRWAEFQSIVGEAMRDVGARSPRDYVERLRVDGERFSELVDRLVIGETYFFREPQQIEELRNRVIPDLGTSRQGKLCVWSAGCASGEEPYSLSILFAEAGLGERVQIVGTDLSSRAIALSREAVYRAWSFRGVDGAYLTRYFSKEKDRFRLEETVKKRVRFAQHNLVRDSYPPMDLGPQADLVLCRNVLIYFTRDRVRAIGEQLLSSLSPGGVLVTGPSDPMLRCDPPFEAMVTPGGLFYRRGEGIPSRRPLPAPPKPALPTHPERESPWNRPPRARSSFPPPPEAPRAEATAIAVDLAEASAAYASGDYERAAELVAAGDDPSAAILRVRALSNCRGTQVAADESARLLEAHPFDAELTYLHATLLLDLGHVADAYRAARQVVYLDRTLEVGHFLMATISLRRGDLAAAHRALRHVHRLASARAADEPIRLADGDMAGAMAASAVQWLVRCEGKPS
jgi:chemotaxis protein methyltransferase CheR